MAHGAKNLGKAQISGFLMVRVECKSGATRGDEGGINKGINRKGYDGNNRGRQCATFLRGLADGTYHVYVQLEKKGLGTSIRFRALISR